VPEHFEQPPRLSEYYGVRITYGSTLEAQNYAEELKRLFAEYAIATTLVQEYTPESLNVPGLRVLIADPSNPSLNEQKTLNLLDAAEVEYQIEKAERNFTLFNLFDVAGVEHQIEKAERDLTLITTLRVGKL
jgi:hypothetical protein